MPIRLGVLQHRAALVTWEADPDESEWIEGEPGRTGARPVTGEPWPCVLFLPSPGAEMPPEFAWRSRQVPRPTLLFDPARVVGEQPLKDDQLDVTAPELSPWSGGETVRWQLDGQPQPAGPPGRKLAVVLAILRRVDD